MRYSLYKNRFEDVNQFRLYLKMQDGDVILYKFITPDLMFSNLPTATRWFGKFEFGTDDYYLYPIDENGISVGEFEVIQMHEKFIKIKFINGKLEGEWIIRHIKGGEVLFWKPKPEGFVCGMNHIEVVEREAIDSTRDILKVKQAFGAHLLIDGRNFSGPCMSAGIVTDAHSRTSTLFTDKFLRKFTKKLKSKMSELIVDIDHEFLTTGDKEGSNTGKITEIKLNENDKINYIWCKGQTTHAVPAHAGLSVTLETEIVWDDKLNIYVAVDGEPIGIAITDKIQPACKICWIE